jgi:hypothetical protein
MDASNFIALGALVASGFAVWYAREANKRGADAERRDVERLEAERRDRNEARRADLRVVPTGGSGGPTAERIAHYFEVTNVGRASATEWYVWIRDDSTGEDVSTKVGGPGVIAPGDTAKPAAVEVDATRLTDSSRLTVWIRWHDAAGGDKTPTDVHPPLHRGDEGAPMVAFV